jgi:hypothetical protein
MRSSLLALVEVRVLHVTEGDFYNFINCDDFNNCNSQSNIYKFTVQ